MTALAFFFRKNYNSRKKPERNDVMFSNEPRVTYRKNQLGEVICQLRFPEILSIGAKPPVDFTVRA